MRDAEALVCDAGVIKALFPCPAPHLKLIFLTNAGLDRLAPFTWLPPGVVLMNNRGTHAAKSGEFAHHVDPDAGQPGSGHGDQPAPGRVAQAVGIGRSAAVT